MTYKNDIINDLKIKWIYYKIRLNKKFDNLDEYTYFDRGYYVIIELVDFLLQWNSIKIYAKYPWKFIKLVWLWSTTALRYAILTSKKYIHFQKWFYNKKELIKYLLLTFKG